MDADTQLGLQIDLWINGRDREPLKQALNGGHALHWAPIVSNAIAQNRANGRSPSSFQQLAEHLRRDVRNVYRWKTGEYPGTVSDFVALAKILQVPVRDLFPCLGQWYGLATVVLCGNQISMSDAKAFGAYAAFPRKVNGDDLDPDAVANVLSQMNDGRDATVIEKSILRGAKAVGSLLLRLGWKLPPKERLR